eukprot:CAMPEP_0196726684 /NCGR_PEP_ID=MMETSP1091-20130531/7902_1 /TAXON_ID=302021 /ORGANISM="Rhodomonas sp., Strain CCMP768" /LENGTH=110 /DNA_ID=CAMNT_0042069167 /DNA_START=20 /DNA_END=352 /DNA_ORIENTATION=-
MQRVFLLFVVVLASAAAFAPSPLALRSSPSQKSSRSACSTSGIVGAKMVATLPPMGEDETAEPKPNPVVAWWQGLTPGKQAVYALVATKETAIVALNWGWIMSHIQGTAN